MAQQPTTPRSENPKRNGVGRRDNTTMITVDSDGGVHQSGGGGGGRVRVKGRDVATAYVDQAGRMPFH